MFVIVISQTSVGSEPAFLAEVADDAPQLAALSPGNGLRASINIVSLAVGVCMEKGKNGWS